MNGSCICFVSDYFMNKILFKPNNNNKTAAQVFRRTTCVGFCVRIIKRNSLSNNSDLQGG